MKRFNVNGICYKDKHYMVNIDSRLEQIKEMVDNGDYFTINRARQYGKTTTLYWLEKYLQEDYYVISTSFEGSDAMFTSIETFVQGFVYKFANEMKYMFSEQDVKEYWELQGRECKDFDQLSVLITELCHHMKKPIVLFVDEVDRSSDNQIFLGFLGMLRNKYLERGKRATFQSVILAGVYDIKNLKQKLRTDEEHKYNSPWNIAADFDVEMSFSTEDIAGMLMEYEHDHSTGMNIHTISQMIYDYTSGYPYLVSRICKLMDEKVVKAGYIWNDEGIRQAIKLLLNERNTLFDDMVKKLEDYPELRSMLYAILFQGKSFAFNPLNYVINIGAMFYLIKCDSGIIRISNRIFETVLYNLFVSEEMLDSKDYHAAELDKNQFIIDGQLDMELVLEKFAMHFSDIYSDCADSFLEENGRRFFLLYLKPIINGVGHYYVEARTRDMRRTDIIVDYRGKQYVIELKIWRGDEYNHRGEEQLAGYLDAYHLDKGYMLSFNFNKNKQVGKKFIECQGKTIVEVVV